MDTMRDRRGRSILVRRLTPVMLCAAVVGLAVVVRFASGDGSDQAASTTTHPVNPGAVPSTHFTVPTTERPVVTVEPPSTSTPASVLERTLVEGDSGDDVRDVEERLAELGFLPGALDGVFDADTRRAVWAFEKLVFDVPSTLATGRVTPDTWRRMQDRISVTPRRPSPGVHVEVYLPEQVLIAFDGGKPLVIAHISAGDGLRWCDTTTIDVDRFGEPLQRERRQRLCGAATTPGGLFQIYRTHDGWRRGELGEMYRPMFFNFGIALYGADDVPAAPATRGGVSVSLLVADALAEAVEAGTLVFVWDGVKEPEEQTADEMRPAFPSPPDDGPSRPPTTPATTTTTIPPTTEPTSTSTTVETTTTTTATTIPPTSAPTTAPTTTSTSTTTTVPSTTTTSTTTTTTTTVATTTSTSDAPPAPSSEEG